MNDLKLSLCRCKEFVFLGLLCFFSATGFAGESKAPQPISAKPVIAPIVQPNTTFRSDLTLPHPEHHLAWDQDHSAKKQVDQAITSRWLKDLRMLIQEPHPVTGPTSAGNPQSAPQLNGQTPDQSGIQWKPLIAQSLTFLWIEHGFRFLTEPGTREELKGPFFKDWFQSAKNTRGWRDGDPFIVNYIGHPMQGSVTNYMFVHNDPKYIREEMGFSKAYFKSRLRAMLFSTVYSTQFELGPLSEASLGNVGLFPSKTSRHPSAFVDLVVTPTLGTAWTMGEDALDRFIIKRMETHVENRVVRLLVRSFLNPSRSFANALRGKYPWNRDGRRL
ncbi:MAG: hypothetical protein JST84_16175 [Acidobacteria bacterium]|nr:hypothetical protein [Acidobacteriota bacterium]